MPGPRERRYREEWLADTRGAGAPAARSRNWRIATSSAPPGALPPPLVAPRVHRASDSGIGAPAEGALPGRAPVM